MWVSERLPRAGGGVGGGRRAPEPQFLWLVAEVSNSLNACREGGGNTGPNAGCQGLSRLPVFVNLAEGVPTGGWAGGGGGRKGPPSALFFSLVITGTLDSHESCTEDAPAVSAAFSRGGEAHPRGSMRPCELSCVWPLSAQSIWRAAVALLCVGDGLDIE